MSRRASIANWHQAVSTLELALRAAQSGLTTCVIQLHPGREPYGEIAVPDELFAKLNIFPALRYEKPGEEAAASTPDSLELARLALACGRYDLVILDEVQSALSAGGVREDDIRRLADPGGKTRLIAVGMPGGNCGNATSGSPVIQQLQRNHATA